MNLVIIKCDLFALLRYDVYANYNSTELLCFSYLFKLFNNLLNYKRIFFIKIIVLFW